jgi:putative transcriptional regulator
MSISQHPTDETLTAFAAGNLDEGRSVVVAAHAEMCARCRGWIATVESIGGARLSSLPPASMAGDALSLALARIDRGEYARKRKTEAAWAVPQDLGMLPTAARSYPIGRWRWMGPGVHWRPLEVPSEQGARVFLLKAAPGTKMPHHTHTGTELTLVLSGAFTHQGGSYGPGDLDEADDTVEHQPMVARGEHCVCLVAMEGKLRLLGFVGRLLQPFVRI